MQLTQPLAWAAAQDAGSRSMHKARRETWSVDDYNAAVREYSRLMATLPDSP